MFPVYSGPLRHYHNLTLSFLRVLLCSMQAAQILVRHRALQQSVRSLATTASANPVHVTSYTSSSSSAIPLSNVEAQWERLTSEEQITVHHQLEELQKKDWRELSIDEKKAGAYPSSLFVDNRSFISFVKKIG
jgi:Cytochrome c oxidase subunit IV